MAGLRADTKSMRDVTTEQTINNAQGNSFAQYVDSLPEDRSFMEKLTSGNGINPGNPHDAPVLLQTMDAIRTGQLDEPRIQKLMKRNPMAASVFANAFDEYKKAAQTQETQKGIYSKYFQPAQILPLDQMGPTRPATADYHGAITALTATGPQGAELAAKLAAIEKAMREGGGKGMYGGIRTGIIPGTKQLIEYGVDEATGQAREVGTNRVLTRGKDYEPTIGQTIMPVAGGGLEAFPSRGGIGAPLPSTPTGKTAMPSESETVKTGQAINANAMAQEMQDLVSSGKVKVGPYEGRKLSIATTTGLGLTPEDAKYNSLEENYSNALLQAARGAQVGPAEQIKFEKSLPRRNQPKEVWLANLKTTTDNINRLNAIESRLRAVPKLTEKEKIKEPAKAEEWTRVNGIIQRKQ